MKTRLVTIFAAIAFLGITATCSAQGYPPAGTTPEQALVNAGFKVKPARTAEQRAQLHRLPDREVTAVNEQGTYYYLYADKQTGRLYCGTDAAYRKFKWYVQTQRDRENGALSYENKHHQITVTKIYGWAPFNEW
jgi:hypothetical protein